MCVRKAAQATSVFIKICDKFQVFINRTIIKVRFFSSYQLNTHYIYSITIYEYMLHYNPQHVSSSTLLISRKTNYIFTASGTVTLCKRPYNMPLSTGIL